MASAKMQVFTLFWKKTPKRWSYESYLEKYSIRIDIFLFEIRSREVFTGHENTL